MAKNNPTPSRPRNSKPKLIQAIKANPQKDRQMRLALYTKDDIKVLTPKETVKLTTEQISAYIADGYKLKGEKI